ncbi:MAG TPA: tryptophan 7-halogenase [Syntrophales bacterium]|nr:tryptophan 7-halogenase [Syntrophales bacterium]
MIIEPLKNNSKVGIIGAGPAGTFFALHLMRMGSEKGRKFDITIFDSKLFTDTGARGCNMCAGAISSTLFNNLTKLDFVIPREVLKDKVTGYVMHLKGETGFIDVDPSSSIYTVFRSAGPVFSAEKIRGFDQVLLDFAVKEGARFVNQRVKKVIAGSKEKISLIYGEDGREWEGDLLVGAFGVNSRIVENLKFGYKPPKCWSACQTEIEVSEDFAEETIQNKIHIFNTENPKIKYIAFTPKGNFITVTAIGENVKRVDVEKSLKEDAIASYLPPNYTCKCHCHPKIPINIARNPFSDRFVIIGDAAASRYLKNGIESAFFTGKWAASTALHHGLSSEDFKRNYYSLCRSVFFYDNVYGKILFGIYDLLSNSSVISRVNIKILMEERGKSDDSKILSLIFWHLFTGDAPYSHILREFFRPKLFINFFQALLRGNYDRRA